jgi:hypothetical protein
MAALRESCSCKHLLVLLQAQQLRRVGGLDVSAMQG